MPRIWQCVLASTLAVVARSNPEEAVLPGDECSDETCALNALQHRAGKSGFDDEPNVTAEEANSIQTTGKKFVQCDPYCDHPANDVTDADTELGAGPDELLGAGIAHYAMNCWYACGRRPGYCGYCGGGNACCRWGAHHDPPECRGVRSWPTVHMHTCVQPSAHPAAGGGGSGEACSGRSGGQLMTVYHQTGCDIGPLILKSGFKLGHDGWCGGGIYFAMSPEATQTKAIGPDSHKGFMIEAQVMVGKVAGGNQKCVLGNGQKMFGKNLHNAGYDSIEFNPGDGTELVVYCSSQVISAKAIPWKCS